MTSYLVVYAPAMPNRLGHECVIVGGKFDANHPITIQFNDGEIVGGHKKCLMKLNPPKSMKKETEKEVFA